MHTKKTSKAVARAPSPCGEGVGVERGPGPAMRLQFEVGVMKEEEELATPRRCRPHKSSKSKKGVSQTPREESYRRE